MPFPVLDPPSIRVDAACLDRTNVAPRFAIRTGSSYLATNVFRDRSIASARLSSVFSAAAAELEGYSRLPVGWDGYDGEPISPIAIRIASAIIESLGRFGSLEHKLTDIIPGPASDGSLDLEFRTEVRRLIITIYPGKDPGSVEVRTFRTDSVTSEEKCDLEPETLGADLRWLLA